MFSGFSRSRVWESERPVPYEIGASMSENTRVYTSDSYMMKKRDTLSLCLPDYVIRPCSVTLQFNDPAIRWALTHKLLRGISRPFSPSISNIEISNIYSRLKADVRLMENGCIRLLSSEGYEPPIPPQRFQPLYTLRHDLNEHHGHAGYVQIDPVQRHVNRGFNRFPRINSFNYHVVPRVKVEIDMTTVLDDINQLHQKAIDRPNFPKELNEFITEFSPDISSKEYYFVSAIVLHKPAPQEEKTDYHRNLYGGFRHLDGQNGIRPTRGFPFRDF